MRERVRERIEFVVNENESTQQEGGAGALYCR